MPNISNITSKALVCCSPINAIVIFYFSSAVPLEFVIVFPPRGIILNPIRRVRHHNKRHRTVNAPFHIPFIRRVTTQQPVFTLAFYNPELPAFGPPLLLQLSRPVQLRLRVHQLRLLDLDPRLNSQFVQHCLQRITVGLNLSQQPLQLLGVRFRHRTQRIERRQDLVGFRFGDVQHQHRDFHVRGDLRP